MRFILGEDDDMLLKLQKCIGRRVSKISIEYCDYETELNVISNILNEIRFGKLQFELRKYFQNAGYVQVDLENSCIYEHQ